jgi:hypothetical protein
MARDSPAVKARARYAALMPVHVPNTVDPMAAQMAQLLAESDLDELREIIQRWVAEAPTGAQRRMYENFGARLVELKHALAEAPVQPTREELEQALTMMLRLAAQQTTGAPPPR